MSRVLRDVAGVGGRGPDHVLVLEVVAVHSILVVAASWGRGTRGGL